MSIKFYVNLSIIIGFVGAIGGIVLGNIYKVPAENVLKDPSFNWFLMFSVWISTFLLDAVFIGIATILDYVKSNYDNINSSNNRIFQIEKTLKDLHEKSEK